jgi:hypothetical protein
LADTLEDLNRTQNYSATVNIATEDPAIQNALSLQFDADGLLEVLTTDRLGATSALDLTDPEFIDYPSVQFAYDFATSDFEPEVDHALAELFIDRELLGDFGEYGIESFFDITYQVNLDGIPGPAGLFGPLAIDGQQVTLDPQAEWVPPFPVPHDENGDLEPEYPSPFAPGPMPAAEQQDRNDAIAGIPEPTSLILLAMGVLIVGGRRRCG